ncbi:hypothetical protein V7S43_008454 [Phytophthora oleae]|uniref:Uncharacterized protein n=1 Tax=Phytophthora oleae TaxID=2107226 RepID=A0ABD3FM69_9STRA
MELSQLRFRVFHKPGTAMGHADRLSILHALPVIASIAMQDLLNPMEEGSERYATDNRSVGMEDLLDPPTNEDSGVPIEVGE